MRPFETLEFLEMFFKKFTISQDIEDYKDKVQKQGIDLQPFVVLSPKELRSLFLLIENHGLFFTSFFL